jgi:hypothetical protein
MHRVPTTSQSRLNSYYLVSVMAVDVYFLLLVSPIPRSTMRQSLCLSAKSLWREYTLTFTTIGESAVGKSSIVMRFVRFFLSELRTSLFNQSLSRSMTSSRPTRSLRLEPHSSLKSADWKTVSYDTRSGILPDKNVSIRLRQCTTVMPRRLSWSMM